VVSINPDRVKVIKLSKEEQMAILQHCPHLKPDIAYRIANSIDGIVLLTDYEAYDLRGIVEEQISRIINEKDNRTLCKVSNKLSPNPVIASITEELMDKDFKDVDELQKEVTKINERHNNTPDPEMAGLSPNQVFRLINLPWENENFAIKFNNQLSIDDVCGSYFYKNSMILLNTLIELESENTATVAGNLSRDVLKMLFGRIILREVEKFFVGEFNRSFNERNFYTIHETRTICQMANLIRKKGRKFLVIRKYRDLLLDENAGNLYYLLFATFFRRFNIAYRDGFPALYSIQSTIPFSFYVIKRFADDLCSINDLEEKIFLPAVGKEITGQSRRSWDITGLIHTRIIEPLIIFGLIEVVRGSGRSAFNVESVRKTELFDKFMKFSL
jgi:hypothetical protein